jgi:hypothetical protein
MENNINVECPTATQQIYDYIDRSLGNRGPVQINRASSASQCYLKRWFQKQGYPEDPLGARVIVNFTLGDLTEHTLKYFISQACVGPGKLYSEVDLGNEVGRFTIQNGKEIVLYDQPDTTAFIGPIEVSAHQDGWGKRNSDGIWELIEIKSSADFGFERFKEEGPGEYLKQAMVNLLTDKAEQLGAFGVRFFYLKKNTGHLWDRYFAYDGDLADEVKRDYELSNGKERPETPYSLKQETFRAKPTGRWVAQYPCSYCSYLKECHGPHTVEFKGSNPQFVFNKKEIA